MDNETNTRTETRASSSDGLTAMVVDLPNLNGHIRELAGGKSGPATRVDFQGLVAFLLEQASEAARIAATVFMQVPSETRQLAGFVTALRNLGIGVFARPEGDIDDNLVAHVESEAAGLQHLMIVSHDCELIQRCLAAVAKECTVTIIGFEEFSSAAIKNDRIDFIDLGELDGVLPRSLVRSLLHRLPSDGALLPPLRSPRSKKVRSMVRAT